MSRKPSAVAARRAERLARYAAEAAATAPTAWVVCHPIEFPDGSKGSRWEVYSGDSRVSVGYTEQEAVAAATAKGYVIA